MEAKMALIEIVRKFKIETKVRISVLITVIPRYKLLRFSNFSKCSHMCKLEVTYTPSSVQYHCLEHRNSVSNESPQFSSQ